MVTEISIYEVFIFRTFKRVSLNLIHLITHQAIIDIAVSRVLNIYFLFALKPIFFYS